MGDTSAHLPFIVSAEYSKAMVGPSCSRGRRRHLVGVRPPRPNLPQSPRAALTGLSAKNETLVHQPEAIAAAYAGIRMVLIADLHARFM